MAANKELFGHLADGREVFGFTIKNTNGLRAKILTFGGRLCELFVPDRNGVLADVIGGYDELSFYEHQGDDQGALIGRVGNRIARGKFSLDGKEYTLECNNGENHLHGGFDGFQKKLWEVVAECDNSLTLRLFSPDGEEGYPSDLTVEVTYLLTEENGLRISYRAESDRATPLNLTNHAYFNLGGYDAGEIRPLRLWLDADTYLPTDAGLIPTGEIRSVSGTPFDFRVPKSICEGIDLPDDDLLTAGGYDHCLNFTGGATEVPVLRGELYDPASGRVMEIYTDAPSVQLYSGNFLGDGTRPFKGGVEQRKQSLLCLETQRMPDSVNHPHFTDTVLREGEVFVSTTEYRFSVR